VNTVRAEPVEARVCQGTSGNLPVKTKPHPIYLPSASPEQARRAQAKADDSGKRTDTPQ